MRAILWVAACCFTVAAAAQTPSAPAASFQAYALRHSRVEAVQPRLIELLTGLNEPVDLIPDAAGNRLLVQGSPQAHAMVVQALSALDRAEAVAPPTPVVAQPGPPQVRPYSVPPALLAVLNEELNAQFGPAGVRTAADPRTSLLIVVAPEEMQRQVAAHLAARMQAPSQPAPAPQTVAAAPTVAGPMPANVHQLKHLDWTGLESRLRAVYGNRLSPTTAQDGRRRLRLTTDVDGALDLAYDEATNRLELGGSAAKIEAGLRLVAALDTAAGSTPYRLVPYRRDGEESLRKALSVSDRLSLNAAGEKPTTAITAAAPGAPSAATARPGELPKPLMAQLFKPKNDQLAAQQPPAAVQPPAVAAPPVAVPAAQPAIQPNAGGSGLVGPVQIEFLDGLDVLVISGNDRDVERVMKLIEDIERLSVDTQPTVEVYNLQFVASDVMAAVIMQVYDSVLSTRQGKVGITALVKPNALLLVGRAESVEAVKELISKLDQPVEPSAQFSVFMLKYASAATVQTTLTTFFTDRTALGGRLQITTDPRSNAVIVRGGPRDIAEAAELIAKIDVANSASENELRIFPLRNAPADELAPIIQDAVNSQGSGVSTAPTGGAAAAALAAAGGGAAPASARSTALRFTTIDSQGHRQLKSGILTEVRVTADARANSLIVSAPAEAMELIAALIRQLDDTPAAEAQIKVFTIVNGDATSLVEMMQTLFGLRTGAGAQGGGLLGQQQQGGQNPIVQLRFSVDQRTNSIIVSGSTDDLNVVEAILLRLDESDVRQRESTVYRLKNAPALDVANAINQFLRSEREVQAANPSTMSPFEQIEREVVVVPEPVSNSLIVSATPRYFEEIRKLVEDIDARPPMVLIQVLIAEVALNNVDEFGIELGLQDSVLFDRSLLGDLVTITNSTQQPQGNTVITQQNQNIVGATNQPGFAFNNAPLGNSGATSALNRGNVIGTQGISNFAVGRTNAELGYGGLVLSASSESVSVLLRALQETRRLDVLSRPQVMTLDNQAAFVQVGSRVPRVTGVTVATTGQTNNVVDVNVGLILGVTPRISPDGLVVMEIDAEKSALGSEAEGVPISVSATGEVVRQPVINTTTAQTTVSAMSGQTVLLGGLITKSKAVIHRRVPVLSSIPILGNFFRYDNETSERTELLIVMTPHVVRSEADVARTRQIESARMSWCLGDVKRLHGNAGLENRFDDWANEDTTVIYPDGEELPAAQPGEQSTGVTLEPAPLPIRPQSAEIPMVPQIPHGAAIDSTIPAEPTPAPPRPSESPQPMPLFQAPESTIRLQPTDAAAPGGSP